MFKVFLFYNFFIRFGKQNTNTMTTQRLSSSKKPSKAIGLKVKHGPKAFYEAVKVAFDSGHIVTTMHGASNYASVVL